MSKTYEEKEEIKFNYMMLGRLQQDCEYWLNHGNKCDKHLWAGNPKDQIEEMRKIYDQLDEKPEWLTKEQIEYFAKQMKVKYLTKEINCAYNRAS